MKASEVRDMKAEELPVEVTRLRQKLFELRSQAVTEKLENPMQLKDNLSTAKVKTTCLL